MFISNRITPDSPQRPRPEDANLSPHATAITAKPASSAAIGALTPAPPPGRCIEPGCVFPAWDPATRRCHYHVVLESEAELFESCQPILQILAFYMVHGPDPDIEEYRRQQKRMQAIVRELFQRGVA